MTVQYRAGGITLFESALFRTVTTVVSGDDFVLVVDPNWLPDEVATVKRFAERVGDGKKKWLLFTHSDYDHIIGYGAFPGWTTIGSQRFVDNPAREAQIRQAREWDDGYYIERDYALTYPVIDRPIAGDGKTLALGATETAELSQAPGHNFDGLVTFLPRTGTLIVGDYLSNVEFPYVYHSFAAYRATLTKLEQRIASGKVRLLVTGHGDATATRAEMDRRLREARAYLDELVGHVEGNAPFDGDRLFTRYRFPVIMRKFHDKNVALMRKERGSG